MGYPLLRKMSLVVITLVIFGCIETQAVDFDMSVENLGKHFAEAIGLTTDFVFTAGTDYPPIEDDVSFWCTNSLNEKFVKVLVSDSKEVMQTKLDFSRPINFLIHGFLDSFDGGYLKTGNIGWMHSTAEAWAKAADCNVCALDWSRLATYEYTITALQHTRKVAAQGTLFIRILEKYGAVISEISISGHSLGAHIAGFIGAALGGRLYAIFGMDPAGPAFSFPYNFSPSARLDPSDAMYVQCIHTARGTFGVLYKCGHADFYPNLGYLQPGCPGPICSHSRGPQLFRSALNRQNVFLGTHCANDVFAVFYRYQCSRKQDLLGIFNNRISGSFYLYTEPEEPYCSKPAIRPRNIVLDPIQTNALIDTSAPTSEADEPIKFTDDKSEVVKPLNNIIELGGSFIDDVNAELKYNDDKNYENNLSVRSKLADASAPSLSNGPSELSDNIQSNNDIKNVPRGLASIPSSDGKIALPTEEKESVGDEVPASTRNTEELPDSLPLTRNVDIENVPRNLASIPSPDDKIDFPTEEKESVGDEVPAEIVSTKNTEGLYDSLPLSKTIETQPNLQNTDSLDTIYNAPGAGDLPNKPSPEQSRSAPAQLAAPIPGVIANAADEIASSANSFLDSSLRFF